MLQYRLALWLSLIFAILAQAPVKANAEWVALEARYQSHPLQTAYIDPQSIRREGTVVTLSALIEWKDMQGGRTPTRFYSTTLTKQFDCTGQRTRTLGTTDYYGHMGTGEVIGGGVPANKSQWATIEPGTINEGLLKVACEQQ